MISPYDIEDMFKKYFRFDRIPFQILYTSKRITCTVVGLLVVSTNLRNNHPCDTGSRNSTISEIEPDR